MGLAIHDTGDDQVVARIENLSGWRCLAGVGYLTVFDSLGVGVALMGKRGSLEGSRSIRRPYGWVHILHIPSCWPHPS